MCSRLCLGLLFILQVSSLSVIPDDRSPTTGTTGEKGNTPCKSEDTRSDTLRQLLNQETVIRMSLDKKVHDLVKDMDEMKRSVESNNKELQAARKEVLTLKHENSALKAELQLQSNETTLISVDLRTTSRDLANLKTQMADMKTNTDSKNKQLQEEITDAKNDVLALKHENSVLKAELQLQSNETTLISADHRTTSRDLADIKTKMADMTTIMESNSKELQASKKEVLALKHENSGLKAELQLQSNATTLLSDEMNTAINSLKAADVAQSQKTQSELSSAVSSLEVLRRNMSLLISSVIETRVGFTAGVTSDSTSWSGDILVFPYVVTNTGNGYNTNTGKFTAPRTGTYVFFVTGVSWSGNSLSLAIVHNGADKVRTHSTSYASYQTGTNLAVLQLRQGDTVWVRRDWGTSYYSESVPWTTFSGFLL